MSVNAMIRNLQIFCDQVNWCMAATAANTKNKNQVHTIVLTEDDRIELLISENERYYQLLGDRQVKEIDKKAILQKYRESKIY